MSAIQDSEEWSGLAKQIQTLKQKQSRKQDSKQKSHILVRECKDAGLALVPCDPLGETCPPASHLKGTPYLRMYSSVGTAPHNRIVRCVPSEMVEIPEVPTEQPASVEEEERQLDTRFRRSADRILSQEKNMKRLSDWTRKAPCGAVMGHKLKHSCATMRFDNPQEGRRCLSENNTCFSNLMQMRKSMDYYTERLMHYMTDIQKTVKTMQERTGTATQASTLIHVTQGMEIDLVKQAECAKHTSEEQCTNAVAVDKSNPLRKIQHCMYDENAPEGQQCSPFDCTAVKSGAPEGQQCEDYPSCKTDKQNKCVTIRQCEDMKLPQVCNHNSKCLWRQDISRCTNAVNSIIELLGMLDNVQLQIRTPPDAGAKHEENVLHSIVEKEVRSANSLPLLGGGENEKDVYKLRTLAGKALCMYRSIRRIAPHLDSQSAAFQGALRLDKSCGMALDQRRQKHESKSDVCNEACQDHLGHPCKYVSRTTGCRSTATRNITWKPTPDGGGRQISPRPTRRRPPPSRTEPILRQLRTHYPSTLLLIRPPVRQAPRESGRQAPRESGHQAPRESGHQASRESGHPERRMAYQIAVQESDQFLG